MIDPKVLTGSIEEAMDHLRRAVPGGLAQEVEKNFRAVLTAGLGKLDLVTREEFEVQSQVLARTRARLEALEKQVADMEKQLRP